MSRYTYPTFWKADKPEVDGDWQLFDPESRPLTDEKGLVFFPTQERAQAEADKLNARHALNR